MIKFIRGYYEDNQRINEWDVDGKTIKSTFDKGSVVIIDGNVIPLNLMQMQKMVDKSVARSENYGY